jgi:glutathione synthase/RimK-type ligase-like ATP-grasp enzyme
VHRALRIAILTRKPDATGSVLLKRAAMERGHVTETLDVGRLALRFEDLVPGLMRGKVQLGHFDAVIPRIGASSTAFSRALVRQLEMMGSVSLNPAEALDCLVSPLSTRQALLASGVPTLGPVNIGQDEAKAVLSTPLAGSALNVLVCGRSTIGALVVPTGGRARDAGSSLDAAARRTALLAARSLQLRLAAVDLVAQRDRYVVASVSPLPSLGRFERLTGRAIGHLIIADVESQVRSWVRREQTEAATDDIGKREQ